MDPFRQGILIHVETVEIIFLPHLPHELSDLHGPIKTSVLFPYRTLGSKFVRLFASRSSSKIDISIIAHLLFLTCYIFYYGSADFCDCETFFFFYQ